jgi:anti-sigma factor RsiW
VIEKLENNEQILLMYLADELPPEDRGEVEQMLRVDASMQREFERLQATHKIIHEQLASLDALSPLPVSAQSAWRQVGRAMRRHLARPKIAPAVPQADHAPHSWRWLYPTIAAASIAIIAMVWLGKEAQPHGNPPISLLPHLVPHNVATSNPVAESQTADSDDSLLIQSLADAKPVNDEDPKQLAEAVPQDEISQFLLNAASSEGH